MHSWVQIPYGSPSNKLMLCSPVRRVFLLKYHVKIYSEDLIMAGKTCQICGKPSGIYPLCKEHLELKNAGKVVKNESGSWVVVEEDKTTGETNCVICGKSSNGKP